MKHELFLWHTLGLFFPALQAYWANRVIRASAEQSVEQSGQFVSEFVNRWEVRLKEDPVLGGIADQIYDHEASRRESIAARAQGSLNSISLIIAVLSFVIAIAGNQWNLMEVAPTWTMWLGALYFLMAFICAFRAVQVQRFFAVEYDEFKALVNAHGGDQDAPIVARGIRARRLAAVFQNRRQMLIIANLVEASFLNLRNGIFVLVGVCAWLLVFSALEGSAVITEHDRDRQEDQDTNLTLTNYPSR